MNTEEKARSILRFWAQQFHDYGDYDDGIEIVDDGYATDDEGNEDESKICYAIFVHRDSLSGAFPEHETARGFIVHRPSEEACFYVWLNLESGEEHEINTPNTKLDINKVYQLIIDIQSKYEE